MESVFTKTTVPDTQLLGTLTISANVQGFES